MSAIDLLIKQMFLAGAAEAPRSFEALQQSHGTAALPTEQVRNWKLFRFNVLASLLSDLVSENMEYQVEGKANQ